MNEEISLSTKFTQWRVFYKNRVSRLVTTKPLTPSECLKRFRKSYGVIWMDGEKMSGLQK